MSVCAVLAPLRRVNVYKAVPAENVVVCDVYVLRVSIFHTLQTILIEIRLKD